MKDYIQEGNLLIIKELYEAFNYFYSGNKAIGVLATEPIKAKHHYIKQDIGHKFMYNCHNYGIKFIHLFDLVFKCEIVTYIIENNNEIVKSRMIFRFDFMNNKLIDIDSFYSPYSKFTNSEAVKVLFK